MFLFFSPRCFEISSPAKPSPIDYLKIHNAWGQMTTAIKINYRNCDLTVISIYKIKYKIVQTVYSHRRASSLVKIF